MNIKECLVYAQNQLKGYNLADYKAEARLIILYLFKLNTTDLLLSYNKKASIFKLIRLKLLLLKRKKGIPLFYILKSKHFWNYDFFVNKNVLIPRNETELIIEYVLKYKQSKDKAYKILDIGTGSGVLGLTLLKEYKNANALLIDCSFKALNVAKKNAKNLLCSNRARFSCSYLVNSIKEGEKFDIIVANLPYICISEISEMSEETKKFEPKLALYAKNEGLALYEELFKSIKNILTPNGIFIFEFGYKQSEKIEKLCKENGFKNYYILPDLNKINRFCLLYL